MSCILILLLTTAAASLGYYLVMRPLRDMETALRRMAASDYTARMPCSNCRELAVLEEAFNAMADHLDAAFEETYQKGIALRESESRLLAAQINPHFVFNVLETIHMRCVEAGLKDLSRMVTDLAQLCGATWVPAEEARRSPSPKNLTMSAITWICSRAVSERRICTFLSIMRMRIFYTASYQG